MSNSAPTPLLGAAFREIVALSGEDATDMNDVLSRLEKIGVLESADIWRTLRVLRNTGAHVHDNDDIAKTEFINGIAAQSGRLIAMATQVARYAKDKLGLDPS